MTMENIGELITAVNSSINMYISFSKKQRITLEKSLLHKHEWNGVTERFNQTLTTMARELIMNLGLSLWAEAVATACYSKNCLPHAWLPETTTVYEALQGKKHTKRHLQPFNRNCWVHIQQDSRTQGTKNLPRV